MTTGKPVSDLHGMLAGMKPTLHEKPYVFLHVLQEGKSLPPAAFALIQEEEGKTLILPVQGEAKDSHFARITLQVHSDLEGVGLTSAVATALAEAGIACNVIAGFHHDHLFVPWERREEALAILQKLSQDARR